MHISDGNNNRDIALVNTAYRTSTRFDFCKNNKKKKKLCRILEDFVDVDII